MESRRIQNPKPRHLTIRKGTPNDRDAIFNVFYHAVRQGAARFYTEKQRMAWAPKSEPDQTPKNHSLLRWVAEMDGDIIGFIAVTPTGYVDLAYVSPEWMGRGVAQALYDEVLEWAHRARLSELTSHASHFAKRFFLKNNWQVVYPEAAARGDQLLERFFMRLKLETKHETPDKPRR